MEEKIKKINTSVSIRVDQSEFINKQSRNFNLSKFIQHKLDEYMEERNKGSVCAMANIEKKLEKQLIKEAKI